MKKLLALLAVLALGTQVSFAGERESHREGSGNRAQGGVFARKCRNKAHKEPVAMVKNSEGKYECPNASEHASK